MSFHSSYHLTHPTYFWHSEARLKTNSNIPKLAIPNSSNSHMTFCSSHHLTSIFQRSHYLTYPTFFLFFNIWKWVSKAWNTKEIRANWQQNRNFLRLKFIWINFRKLLSLFSMKIQMRHFFGIFKLCKNVVWHDAF